MQTPVICVKRRATSPLTAQTITHLASHSSAERRIAPPQHCTLRKTSSSPDKLTWTQIKLVNTLAVATSITQSDRRSGATFLTKATARSPYHTLPCDVTRFNTFAVLDLPSIFSRSLRQGTTTQTVLQPVSTESTSSRTGTFRSRSTTLSHYPNDFSFEVSVSTVFARFRISRLAKSAYSTEPFPNFRQTLMRFYIPPSAYLRRFDDPRTYPTL